MSNANHHSDAFMALSPAKRMFRLFGVETLCGVVNRSEPVVRKWSQRKEKQGQGGLVPVRHHLEIIEHAIATGTLFRLEYFYPAEVVERLEASNARIAASEEEAA